jgi:hypothetical protein
MKGTIAANTSNKKLTYYYHKTFLHLIVLKRKCTEYNSNCEMISSVYHKWTLSKCYFPHPMFKYAYIHRREQNIISNLMQPQQGIQVDRCWTKEPHFTIPFVHIVNVINFMSSLHGMHKMNALWECYIHPCNHMTSDAIQQISMKFAIGMKHILILLCIGPIYSLLWRWGHHIPEIEEWLNVQKISTMIYDLALIKIYTFLQNIFNVYYI